MHLLPFERLTLRSESPPEVVEARLASIVAARGFRLRASAEPFRGTVKGRRFKILRVLGSFLGMRTRNSWQPVVVGTIVPVPDGTEVRVRLRLQIVVAAVMTIWFGGLFCGAAMLLWSGLTEGFGPHIRDGREVAGAGYGLPLVGAMLMVGYAMMSVAFWAEVKKARLLLCESLGCREVEPARRLVRP